MVDASERRGPRCLLSPRALSGAGISLRAGTRLSAGRPGGGDTRARPAANPVGCRAGAVVRPSLPSAGEDALLRPTASPPVGDARYPTPQLGASAELGGWAHVWRAARYVRLDGPRGAGQSARRHR